MIKNQRQFKATKTQIASFREAITDLRALTVDNGQEARRHEASLRAMQSMLTTMERQLAEYEALTRGDTSNISLNGLHDLPKALIQTRIARGLSQKQLAELLGVKPQQVQRWEHEDYDRITFSRLEEVADSLNISRKLELRRPTTANTSGSSGPIFGELRCLSSDHSRLTSWFRTDNAAFIHAKGTILGAANEGSGTGTVSVTESSQGISVKVVGLGSRIDGIYSKASTTQNVVTSKASWSDNREGLLRA